MKHPQSIIVIDLFPEILTSLLALLSGLSEEAWARPTACAGWSVHDVALHLWGGDVGLLSRGRDGYQAGYIEATGWEALVAAINEVNARWVEATRRMSPRLLVELLKLTGDQVNAYFRGLDPYALGGPVSWAGPDPAPVWLDLAREYTERWHHQQHIRDAVGQPGLTEPRYLAPVLDTFVRALPHTYSPVAAAEGTLVTLTILGAAGGQWSLRREGEGWRLYQGTVAPAQAEVVLAGEVAWRLFTKGISQAEARQKAEILGEPELGVKMLDAISIIA